MRDVCLSRDEKELGVFLIDLGGEQQRLPFSAWNDKRHSVLPVGGDHITNDLAVGLRTTFELAEKIKVEYGFALPDYSYEQKKIEIEGIGRKEVRSISTDDLFTFIEPACYGNHTAL